MNEDQKRMISQIANWLMYLVPATPIGETGDITTYTLGLMLAGMLSLEEEEG